MTDARLVSFSSVMNSLPVGGITIRTACGTITRRSDCHRFMPSARMARSAPLQYGAEVSASQNRWVSKLASTLRASLLHVARRDLLLRGQLPQRAVLLQRPDRALERLAELRVGLAVIDPEGVLLGE